MHVVSLVGSSCTEELFGHYLSINAYRMEVINELFYVDGNVPPQILPEMAIFISGKECSKDTLPLGV